MKVKAYPKYKDSGVEWLGHVPEHWGTKRGRFCMKINPRSDRLRALDIEDEVSFIPMEAIAEHGGLNLENTRQVAEVGSGYTEFQDGDVVVAKITPCFENYKGAIAEGLVNGAAFGTTELHVLRVSQQIERRFLFYLTMSSAYRRNGEAEMYGAGGQKRVPPDFNKDFPVPLPPNPEQLLIADFLYSETKKIDTLLSKKRALIEKLKEKRTALISRTVTRGLPPEAARAAGLDPHPKLKPSGVEWLGDVPEHWEILKVRRVSRLIKTGSTPPTAQDEYYEEGTVPWYGPGSFNEQITLDTPVKFINESAIKSGAARLFRAGSTMVVGIGATLGKVSSIVRPASCNQQITVIEFDERRVFQKFGTYQLKQLETILRSIAPSATLPILSQGDIADVVMALPPLEEQQRITDFLDIELEEIKELIEKIEAAIDRLQEFRTALITATVTGKIDVRQEADGRSRTATDGQGTTRTGTDRLK